MGSFLEENGGLDTKGLIQEQTGTEVSTNDMHVAPAVKESKEDLRARTGDPESHPNQAAEQSVTVKAGMSEEIQSLKSKLHANETLVEARKKPARRSNRRRK